MSPRDALRGCFENTLLWDVETVIYGRWRVGRSRLKFNKYQWTDTATTCVDRSWPYALQELNSNRLLSHIIIIIIIIKYGAADKIQKLCSNQARKTRVVLQIT